MERLDAYADMSIRRACAFVGLGAAVVMMSLSFAPALAFRTGAEIAAILALGLAISGWRVPRRNIRHTEVYAMLRSAGAPAAQLAQATTRARIAQVLRARLFWHAERVAVAALVLWLLAGAFWLSRNIARLSPSLLG